MESIRFENFRTPMVESIGRQLQQVRQKRGLTIDEAAHATKLRPDKITALEIDDYSRFASNAYAKGFLQIYGRFLGVDVSEFARNLDSSNALSVSDYQYLNNTPAPLPSRQSDYARETRRAPSIVPLIVFVAILVAGYFGYQNFVNWQRINGEAVSTRAKITSREVTAAASSGPVAAPAPAQAITPAPNVGTPPQAVAVPVAVAPASDREFLSTPIPGTPAPALVPTPVATNEVLVEPLRKTWISVRRDDARSKPVFQDFLYPDDPPLKVKGQKVFIEARDPSSIQIRKNGAPIAYQGPATEVQ